MWPPPPVRDAPQDRRPVPRLSRPIFETKLPGVDEPATAGENRRLESPLLPSVRLGEPARNLVPDVGRCLVAANGTGSGYAKRAIPLTAGSIFPNGSGAGHEPDAAIQWYWRDHPATFCVASAQAAATRSFTRWCGGAKSVPPLLMQL